MISLLLFPIFACLILVVIHVYFGSIVLKRGIIFIDLALAQWAALGFLIGNWLHIKNSILLFLFGYGFTIIASFLLTFICNRYQTIPVKEAIIGALYVSGVTVAMVTISSTGMEGHHIQDMLSGDLLFIQQKEIFSAYLIYSLVLAFSYKYHHALVHESSNKWRFIFYSLFGLVVTSSVKMVGLLLVFSYLVLPILTAILFSKSYSSQLKYGWGIGLLASMVGLFLSTILDISPSYSIVMILVTIWIICILFQTITQSKESNSNIF